MFVLKSMRIKYEHGQQFSFENRSISRGLQKYGDMCKTYYIL